MKETVEPERVEGEAKEQEAAAGPRADNAPPGGDAQKPESPAAAASAAGRKKKKRDKHWRRRAQLPHEPEPGASPGTLMPQLCGTAPRIFLMDYDKDVLAERELNDVEEIIPYLTDDRPSITWVDVRGIGNDPSLFQRIGEIFKIHPLALEDIVNVPQRPKADLYTGQQIVIARMVQLDADGLLKTEQLGVLFGPTFVLTVQEDADDDVLERVRLRLRKGRGLIRTAGADYLAYAIIDAVIDGFYPVLEKLGERIEELELEATSAKHGMSKAIHDIKRELLTLRRAIWPQRDLLNALLREESPFISKETRIYLRDTYDHAVQVMDMVETFREIASGLMDLYLSGVSNRMNEIMKVLTILSTIFLPITAIGGIYGMNFHHEASPYNMPELDWRYGYPFALGLMGVFVAGLLIYYRKKGWIQMRSQDPSATERGIEASRQERSLGR